MGLKIHSLGRIPSDIDREYFVYLLDYGWDEPLSRSLRANFDKMASLASRNNAIVIAGFDGEEFTNEVFSYYRINGQPGSEILPAILVTTCHPHKFAEQNQFPSRSRFYKNALYDDRLVLIPLKPACKSETEVAEFIEKIFHDIQEKKESSEFQVHKYIARGNRGALVDALILQPNLAGIGLDLKTIGKFLFQGWKSNKGNNTH